MELKRIKEIFSFEKGSLQSSKCTAGEYNFITASSDWKTHNSFDYECEALIVAVAASGSLGRVHYVNDKFISSDLCFVLKPKDSSKFPVNLEFYYAIFKSLKEDLVKSTATGTAKKSINKTNFGNYVIPYYNIEEQNRLKPVFEKVADNSEKINQELRNQKQLVSKLKQSMLQEAIQGKLTADWRAQNPNTEPASELLNRIKAEKAQLVKDKKIKKEKPLPPIPEAEIPFEIPEGWIWAKLGDIGKSIIGLVYKPTNVTDNGTPVLRANNIVDYKLVEIKLVRVNCEVPKNKIAEKGDILICARSGSKKLIGKSAIIDKEGFSFGAFNTLYKSSFNEYIHLFLMSTVFTNQINDEKSTGINQLTQGVLRNLIIPFPPYDEQKVIVEKVKALLQKCQALEEEIKTSETNANMLMQAVLKEAFEGKEEENKDELTMV